MSKTFFLAKFPETGFIVMSVCFGESYILVEKTFAGLQLSHGNSALSTGKTRPSKPRGSVFLAIGENIVSKKKPGKLLFKKCHVGKKVFT